MAHEPVQPLRIQKNNSSTSLPKPSPTKMAKALSEISPGGVRRNSPSFNQAVKNAALKGDSSPFDASPENTSLRSFWRTRESASPTRPTGSENTPLHNTPSQRQSSIERLQKASRVKNSNVYARVNENGFDPDSSIMSDRSFMTGRPLTGQAFLGKANGQPTSAQSSPGKGHRRNESVTNIPTLSPSKSIMELSSPTKPQLSPGKSSLSSISRFAETSFSLHEPSVGSDEEDAGSRTPRGTLRHFKSVTFDSGPPQINEYEQITPDPSSVASGSREGSYDDDDEYDMDLSFERGSSADHEDSFDHSLEDTAKTPVVLPEDWRFMSPEAANTGLADTFEDPFERNERSPEPTVDALNDQDNGLARSFSVTSDGEPRPLPPLPMFSAFTAARNASKEQATSGSQSHAPPVPKAASISKDDIVKMQSSHMSLEERLRRLSVQNSQKAHQTSEDGADEPTMTLDQHHEDSIEPFTQHVDIVEQPSAFPLSDPSLKRMKSQNFSESDYDKYANLDPDVPIPSREASSNYEEDSAGVKHEIYPGRKVIDMYAPPEAQFDSRNSSPFEDDYGRESSVVRHGIPIYEDPGNDESQLHTQNPHEPQVSEQEIHEASKTEPSNNENARPVADVYNPKTKDQEHNERKMSLPEFDSFSVKDSFGMGLESFMTPTPPLSAGGSQTAASNHAEFDRETPQTDAEPDEQRSKSDSLLFEEIPNFAPPSVFESQEHEEVGTPDSVIRRSPLEEEKDVTPEEEEVAFVPQPRATVRAPGGKLKTRTSATSAELEALRDQQVYSHPEAPPAIPDRFRNSSILDGDERQWATKHADVEGGEGSKPHRRQGMRMTLDMPLGSGSDDLEFSMDKEFDQLLEAQKVPTPPLLSSPEVPHHQQDGKNAEYVPGQGFTAQGNDADLRAHRKRGYLMRQNTKVVVATNRTFSNEKPPSEPAHEPPPVPSAMPPPAVDRETRSAGNSPRKPSGPTVTTEPWNGKMRRHSTRKSIIASEKPMTAARQSLGNAIETLAEDHQSFLEPEAGAERGRFFVKVMGAKNLDLPLPRNERTDFQLTLDNGLHCVTTSWLELGRNAQIGQEFELTVFDELDFSLTLQTKLERPSSQASTFSQTSSLESPRKKQSAISRLLSSPKKRREAERKQQEEQAEMARQRQREVEAQRANAQPTAWDLLHNLVGPDGSFAQSIVSLDEFEEQAFGRPTVVDVPCYNNWAVEDSFNSTKSKHGGVQRKPPYKIGSLTLQLLYIPKPKGVTDDDMPQSMSACVKQLKEAEANATRSFEGPMSQQGGDCPYWRRRFFKLNGSVLTAYHEATRQRRANIRLAKATKLIDDRTALTQGETSAKGSKGRRRSAFATDTEGYMFVEEGFRICFANGDTIDFYADTRQQKEEWMDHLSNVIGKDFGADKPSWTAAVLAYERMNGEQAAPKENAAPNKDKSAPAPKPSQGPPETQNPLRSNPPGPVKQPSPSKQSSPTKQASPAKQPSPSKHAGQTRPGSPTKQTASTKHGSPTKPSTSAKPTSSSRQASPFKPGSPSKVARKSLPLEKVPPPVEKSPRHSLQASPQKSKAPPKPSDEPTPRQSGSANSGRRKAVRSMIF